MTKNSRLPDLLQGLVALLTIVLLGMDLHEKVQERRKQKEEDEDEN